MENTNKKRWFHFDIQGIFLIIGLILMTAAIVIVANTGVRHDWLIVLAVIFLFLGGANLL